MGNEANQLSHTRLFTMEESGRAPALLYDTVIGGTGRTVVDDSGALAITAWICAKFG